MSSRPFAEAQCGDDRARSLVADDPALRRLKQVYRERAEKLANRKAAMPVAATSPTLVFGLNAEQYGLDLQQVVQVMPYEYCTPVPGAPPSLLGVINLRGQIRSVIDLRHTLELPPSDTVVPGYLVILRYHGNVVGVRVDQVERVQHIALAELIPPNNVFAQATTRFVIGVTPDGVSILDPATLFGECIFKANGNSEHQT